MAISFTKVKQGLGLTDIIPSGKLKGCRVVDVIEDSYEYLIWADKENYLKFSSDVVAMIKRTAGFAEAERHYEEEVAPYLDDFDDVPF